MQENRKSSAQPKYHPRKGWETGKPRETKAFKPVTGDRQAVRAELTLKNFFALLIRWGAHKYIQLA